MTNMLWFCFSAALAGFFGRLGWYLADGILKVK